MGTLKSVCSFLSREIGGEPAWTHALEGPHLKNEIVCFQKLTERGREPELKEQRVFLILVAHTTTSDPTASLGYLSGLW